MNKSLALCIPTYNRCEAVAKVLATETQFADEKFHIYIFDSGTDGKTKSVVDQYKSRYIFYRRVDSSVSSNQKVFMIYQIMTDSEYDYIWVMHDHTLFNAAAIDFLRKSLAKDADFYMLRVQCDDFGVTSFASLDDFLVAAAWWLNCFGIGIVKRQTFLKEIDWDYMSEMYMTEKTAGYSHIGLYFHRLQNMENPKVLRLEFPRDNFCDFMRNEKPSWHKNKFRTCTECWGEIISNLPETYTKKTEAMQTIDRWYLSRYSLLELKSEGNYNLEMYFKYRKWLKKVAPQMVETAFWIALLPYSLGHYIYSRDLLKKTNRAKRENRKICIYGAGRHGIECLNYLENCGISPDAFLVTKAEGNSSHIGKYPVCVAADYLRQNRALVIIGILSDGAKAVESYLSALKEKGADIVCMPFGHTDEVD